MRKRIGLFFFISLAFLLNLYLIILTFTGWMVSRKHPELLKARQITPLSQPFFSGSRYPLEEIEVNGSRLKVSLGYRQDSPLALQELNRSRTEIRDMIRQELSTVLTNSSADISEPVKQTLTEKINSRFTNVTIEKIYFENVADKEGR